MNNDTTEKPSLDILLDQNLNNLINCTASQFFGKFGKYNPNSVMITQEDLAQQGFFGAMTAYESFDPSLGYDDNIIPWFRSYAYPYIKNAMLTYCRKFSHSLSISEKAARDDWGSMINIGVVHIDQFNDDEEFDVPIGDVSNLFLLIINDDIKCLGVRSSRVEVDTSCRTGCTFSFNSKSVT